MQSIQAIAARRRSSQAGKLPDARPQPEPLIDRLSAGGQRSPDPNISERRPSQTRRERALAAIQGCGDESRLGAKRGSADGSPLDDTGLLRTSMFSLALSAAGPHHGADAKALTSIFGASLSLFSPSLLVQLALSKAQIHTE
uniref:Uncharacterized protein n=1 Tax=Knipowitschia caucasica TaxID=637954 RepID=A0AAV2JIZ0_KNICA